MNVLSHISRVKPIAANFRSLGGNFGASRITKLLRISDQSLGEKRRKLSIDDNESMVRRTRIESLQLLQQFDPV
jgi:hypothetical protein